MTHRHDDHEDGAPDDAEGTGPEQADAWDLQANTTTSLQHAISSFSLLGCALQL